MRRALITGGAGFIGFHLSKKLVLQGYAVDLLDNFSRGVRDPDFEQLISHPNVNLIHSDLRNCKVQKYVRNDYQHIYHLAAIVGVANVLEQPYSVLYDNVMLLANAIEIGRQQTKLERFIFFSTSEVYAGTLHHFDLPIPTPEDVPLALTDLSQPRTSYMLSKIYGEALCRQSGLPFTIFRPHNIYGPRMGLSHVIPELLKRAHEAESGESIDVYSVDHKRCFCFITDAVEMIIRAVQEKACANETLNIGAQGPEITIGDLARVIIQVLRKPISIRPGPVTPGSPKRRCPDMSKTIKLTGYKSRIGLAEGISRTYDWYRKNVFVRKGVAAK